LLNCLYKYLKIFPLARLQGLGLGVAILVLLTGALSLVTLGGAGAQSPDGSDKTPEAAVNQEEYRQDKPSQVAKELGLEFVLIKPGTFVMGAEPRLERFTSYALPKHEVTITKPYFIGRFEVTQKQWSMVMDRNASKFKGPGNPVDTVSYDRAMEFIDKLNEKEGRKIFRLPTEAEWEYAARAGSEMVYQYGDAPVNLGDYAWFTNNSGVTTHPVGLLKPNPWGLYDTLGNVREWTSDWLSSYTEEPVTDPKGPSEGTFKMARGGAFNFIDVNCTVSRRVGYAPDSRQNFLGIRLVMDLEEPKEPEPEVEEGSEPKDEDKEESEAKAKEAEAKESDNKEPVAPPALEGATPEPATAEPASNDPASSESASNEPASSEPAASDPKTEETKAADPAATETGANPPEATATAAPEGATPEAGTPEPKAQ
jgi:formylglycine-generating enzyme required for sulfatase activity